MGAIEQDQENFRYLSTLPKTAIQAIYHAVTGKTENLSKWLSGNVVVKYGDFCRLHSMLRDQWNLHTLLADPTTTVVVSDENDRKIQYSSWERFQALQVDLNQVTSDVVLRIELVTELPNINTPQRCILIVTLDSALPIINSMNSDRGDAIPPSFLMIAGRNWRTVDVSIDFVDYILAKNFLGVVEEWFKSLEKIESSRLSQFIYKSSRTLGVISGQSGRIGAAFFLATYYFTTNNAAITLENILFPASLCLIIWSFVQIISAKSYSSIQKKASKSIIPSVILMSSKDIEVYESAKNENPSLVI